MNQETKTTNKTTTTTYKTVVKLSTDKKKTHTRYTDEHTIRQTNMQAKKKKGSKK